MGVDFALTFPSIDNVTKAVLKFGKNCHIAKIDISRAFKHLPIDPRDIKFLGLFWNGYFIERNLCFGYKNGSALFQRFSDSIRFIMSQEGHFIQNYVDDHLCLGKANDCRKAFDRLQILLTELGLQISEHKTVEPCTEVVCLGIVVNTEKFTVSVPKDKLEDIKKVCFSWLQVKNCNKRQLQSLLGSLLYITKCVRYSRAFLNRLLKLLRDNHNNKTIKVNQEARRDITWFHSFLSKFNGTSFFKKIKIDSIVHLDACLTGIGAIFEKEIYYAKIPTFLQHCPIVVLEMFNILVAVRLWSKQWTAKTIQIFCDNEAVVTILKTGKTKDDMLAKIMRNIYMEAAWADLFLTFTHIPGEENVIADTLSRWENSETQKALLNDKVKGHKWKKILPQFLNIDEKL